VTPTVTSTPPDAPVGEVEDGGVAEDAAVRAGSFVAADGAVERGYRLRFDVDEDGATVSNLEADVLETCDGESTSNTITIAPSLTWPLVDGTFSGRQKDVVDGVSVYVTFEGRFTSATTAEGTVRQETVVAGSVCDTYKLHFTATLS
jgi:hypothetical protein